jgi:predicted Zn finger-like uncharacterized protein
MLRTNELAGKIAALRASVEDVFRFLWRRLRLASPEASLISDGMVQTWHKGLGEDFQCPHCGARYEVSISGLRAKDNGSAICAVCNRIMAEWHDSAVPAFRLKKEPEIDA